MNREEIFAKLKDLMVDKLGVDESEIKEDSNIIDDLGADSLDIVEFAMGIEDEFEIPKIPQEDIDKLTTVNAIIDYIQEKTK
ncbi:MAG TPA: acyl carrier protein [Bacteroidetes bacterium]|uniref:Acyl carrier protein n=1 Tax=candidate division TA06 bacterium TaxID=2250710 RepID=A0A660S849_UNCT6|nr:MAG: acyl carrier protein [candidate division TA06 bacterium]HHD83020.1 acyl carrier protein [Bacteroidota bacterium]